MSLQNLGLMVLRIFACASLIAILTACSEVPVAEDLTQEQAREVISALQRNGIEAKFARLQKGEKSYQVVVPPSLANKAAATLHEQGVPDRSRDRFLSALSTNSFLPDSHLVEALRLDHARALQLENLILQLPNVAGAYAVLRLFSVRQSPRLNEKRLSNEQGVVGTPARGQPSAGQGVSIVVRLRSPDESIVDEIKKLVVSVLPELHQDAITIIVSHETSQVGTPPSHESGASSGSGEIRYEEFLFGWRVAADDYFAVAVSFFVIIVLGLLTGGFIGYWVAFLTLHGGAGEGRFRSSGYGAALSRAGDQGPFDAYPRSEGSDGKGRL